MKAKDKKRNQPIIKGKNKTHFAQSGSKPFLAMS